MSDLICMFCDDDGADPDISAPAHDACPECGSMMFEAYEFRADGVSPTLDASVAPSLIGSVGAIDGTPNLDAASRAFAGSAGGVSLVATSPSIPSIPVLLPENRMEQIECVKIASISPETFGGAT